MAARDFIVRPDQEGKAASAAATAASTSALFDTATFPIAEGWNRGIVGGLGGGRGIVKGSARINEAWREVASASIFVRVDCIHINTLRSIVAEPRRVL